MSRKNDHDKELHCGQGRHGALELLTGPALQPGTLKKPVLGSLCWGEMGTRSTPSRVLGVVQQHSQAQGPRMQPEGGVDSKCRVENPGETPPSGRPGKSPTPPGTRPTPPSLVFLHLT